MYISINIYKICMDIAVGLLLVAWAASLLASHKWRHPDAVAPLVHLSTRIFWWFPVFYRVCGSTPQACASLLGTSPDLESRLRPAALFPCPNSKHCGCFGPLGLTASYGNIGLVAEVHWHIPTTLIRAIRMFRVLPGLVWISLETVR